MYQINFGGVFMIDENWKQFLNTGSVEDYHNYKFHEKAKDDEYFNQGFSNQRTDNRGE